MEIFQHYRLARALLIRGWASLEISVRPSNRICIHIIYRSLYIIISDLYQNRIIGLGNTQFSFYVMKDDLNIIIKLQIFALNFAVSFIEMLKGLLDVMILTISCGV